MFELAKAKEGDIKKKKSAKRVPRWFMSRVHLSIHVFVCPLKTVMSGSFASFLLFPLSFVPSLFLSLPSFLLPPYPPAHAQPFLPLLLSSLLSFSSPSSPFLTSSFVTTSTVHPYLTQFLFPTTNPNPIVETVNPTTT